MKICPKCTTRKSLSEFYRNKSTKTGYSSWCKECLKTIVKRWQDENKDRCRNNLKTWRSKNRNKCLRDRRKWYEKNRERLLKYKQMSYRKNPKAVYEYTKRYRHSFPWKISLYGLKQHKKRSLRIPNWLSEMERKSIEQFYANCPTKMIVDHIIPLCGTNVSGLHILSNLQYISPSENSKKGNIFPYVVRVQ